MLLKAHIITVTGTVPEFSRAFEHFFCGYIKKRTTYSNMEWYHQATIVTNDVIHSLLVLSFVTKDMAVLFVAVMVLNILIDFEV